MSVPPGLYLHVPFCATVCPYCDFAVLVGDRGRRERFVESLIDEVRLHGTDGSATLQGFDTIYFGGGTPSMLEPAQLELILTSLTAELAITADPWTFLEANPEDVTEERLSAWADLGVRTLSLGVQSFDPDELRFLGRSHGSGEGSRAVELAMDAGFTSVSLDLIYGLPGQTEGAWRRTLETALALAPDHLSCYELTIHEGTAFGVRKRRGELIEMRDEDQADRFLFTHRFLADHGYPGYEVSNFARSEAHRSRHNQKYWDHTPYLGLGPSAHSFAGRRRWWNQRSLGPWQRRLDSGELPVAASEELSDADLALERLMLGLRTYAGVDIDLLRSRYGLDLESPERAATVDSLLARGLARIEGASLVPTPSGLVVADTLALDLLGEVG